MKVFRFLRYIIASILLLGLFEYSHPAPVNPSAAQLSSKYVLTSAAAPLLSRSQVSRPAHTDTRSSVEIFLENDTISPSTDGFWLQPIPLTAQYESANLDAAGTLFDVNYNVITSNSDPLVNVYIPGAWNRRASGTQPLGQVHFPNSFTLPDAAPDHTPNNPLCTANQDTQEVQCFNAVARPQTGGPLYAYRSGSHGGSGLSGGDITGAALRSKRIDHAVGILVWARKYLSFHNGGFTAPANRADGYASAETYGGRNSNLVMGSRLALRPVDTAATLGIACPSAITVLQALQTYGAYIVDDAAWDAFYISADVQAVDILRPCASDLLKIYRALQIATPPSFSNGAVDQTSIATNQGINGYGND